MNRRKFTKKAAQAGIAVAATGALWSCNEKKKKTDPLDDPASDPNNSPFFKLSLAQWSIHNMIFDKGLDPFLFAQKAKTWGFEGLEYVSGLYKPFYEKAQNQLDAIKKITSTLKQRSIENGMENLIVMVDGEGDFSIEDEKERKQAVENHKKWVDAASELGCHSIRVNLFGTTDRALWRSTSIESLSLLSEYAAPLGVNILVENHGWLSSDAALLADVMKTVNKENCGTLPDFGNFCVKRDSEERWKGNCVEEYDKYKGIAELMPWAKGVSAKSYDFDEAGNETTIDYKKMMQIVKDAGFKGYVGVEYEGKRLSEEEGITKTKELLLKVASELQ